MHSASSCCRDLKQSHSMRMNRRPIAIMQRSCSDSPLAASQMDEVFGSDSHLADWPNVAVRFKLLIKRRVGLTLGLGRSLMHGVAPQMCGSSNQPIVRPRSRGSLPSYLCRLDWRPGTKCCFTCERARGALAYLRGRVPGRGLQFAALRFGARVHAHAPSGHSPSRQVRPATLVRHVVAGTVRGYEVFDEETLFALLATAQRVLAKSAHIETTAGVAKAACL